MARANKTLITKTHIKNSKVNLYHNGIYEQHIIITPYHPKGRE